MTKTEKHELKGSGGRLVVHSWCGDAARYIALVAHGYGEHAGRYNELAQHLVAHGAAVYAPDHRGHGLSDGERALVEDVEAMVGDLHGAADLARAKHPRLPMVLIGHSMGGLLAARFAQRYEPEIMALVLSSPAIGGNSELKQLLALDPIPEIPIDPVTLSRDPQVGRAYAEDPLVFHGPFAHQTLKSLFEAIDRVAAGPTLDVPGLWIHGDDDNLVPLAPARDAARRLCTDFLEERVYPGGRHELFNETNKQEVINDVLTFLDAVLQRT
ncbi:MAG TPA: lysophospholipase [Candidatus Acidoferrales bacterium]|nr:lysophospholipase [Candidatus Acidoferrales bacterium]